MSLTDDIQPSPSFDTMLSVEGGMCSALDVAGAHASYLARYEEQGASSAELGALVPASEVPLHSWEEETPGSTNKEAKDIELIDIGDFILRCVNTSNDGRQGLGRA
jgi:hypothetical protein